MGEPGGGHVGLGRCGGPGYRGHRGRLVSVLHSACSLTVWGSTICAAIFRFPFLRCLFSTLQGSFLSVRELGHAAKSLYEGLE